MSKEIIKNEYEEIKQQLAQATMLQNLKENVKSECKHNMIVLLGYKEVRPGPDMYNNIPVYKCLFCDIEKNSNVNLKKSIKIDAANYCRKNFDMNNEEDVMNKFNIIRNVVFKMTQDIPEMTNEELQTMANQSLNGHSYVKMHD